MPIRSQNRPPVPPQGAAQPSSPALSPSPPLSPLPRALAPTWRLETEHWLITARPAAADELCGLAADRTMVVTARPLSAAAHAYLDFEGKDHITSACPYAGLGALAADLESLAADRVSSAFSGTLTQCWLA